MGRRKTNKQAPLTKDGEEKKEEKGKGRGQVTPDSSFEKLNYPLDEKT